MKQPHNHNVVAIYIHEYGYAADDLTYHKIKNRFPSHWVLIGIEYDITSYDAAMADINKAIDEIKPDVIIGHGIGGFLTLCLPVKNRIVISPLVNPEIHCPKIGMPEEMWRSYNEHKYLPGEIVNTGIKTSSICLMGMHDEILKIKYRDAIDRVCGKTLLLNSFHTPDEGICANIKYMIMQVLGFTYSDEYAQNFNREEHLNKFDKKGNA